MADSKRLSGIETTLAALSVSVANLATIAPTVSSLANTVATLGANASNTDKRLDKVLDYLKDSSDKQSKNHEENIKSLAVIETNQNEFKKYTEECDDERKNLTSRINKVENYQSTLTRVSGVLIAAVTFATNMAMAIFTGPKK